MTVRLAALLGCSLVIGCAAPDVPVEAARLELRGGDVDAGAAYPEVFIVRMRFDNATQFACTATLISARTLMLAAHCFDAAGAGATSLVGAWATNLSPAPPSADPRWIPIVKTRVDPAWTSAQPALHDLSLALLMDDAGIALPTATFSYLDRPLTAADQGASLEVVGYGITAKGATDQGTRRAVTLPLAKLTSTNLELGDLSSKGLCNGDSGGPSLLRGRDGVLRVAGVHSYDSSLQCDYGLDSRVDLFGAFIQAWLSETEGASCHEDGLCKAGCTPVDVDCVCQADGVCNSACPNLLTDVDCPADCVANGVCATQDCPVKDPDCTAQFAACTSAAECQHRLCALDPQTGGKACSVACSASAPCPADHSCLGGACVPTQLPEADAGASCSLDGTFCLSGTACLPAGEAGDRCVKPCSTNPECGSGATCAPGGYCEADADQGAACSRGLTHCTGTLQCTSVAPEPTTCQPTCTSNSDCAKGTSCQASDFGAMTCRAAKGCTAMPGELLWTLAVLVPLLRRRSRT